MSSSAATNNQNQTRAPLSTDAPLQQRMSQEAGGLVQPVNTSKGERKAEKENNHHGAGSSLGEKISNALDFPGFNTKPPPAQTRQG